MTEIWLHNSATRRKERFEPIDPQNVRMYVCGPTVYDRAHIGNARPVVVFDVLFRLLRHVYGEDHVKYVRNITDIDDKINARGPKDFPDLPPLEAIAKVTDKTAGWFRDDMAALGALPPTHEPRATDFVPEMIAMIEALIAKGHAYAAEGHVLFSVDSYADYGALSGRSTEDMIAGARVEVAPYKKNPMDFVLWKPSDDATPGWESPWGRGRPGWHIECSAMSSKLLGVSFDIHGGGADLMFPHHENEIAQSCCAAPGAEFAKVWMHNGMINVDGRKMSKSLGNFLTVADLRDQAPGEVLRLALLSTHYRGVLDWTAQKLEEARVVLTRWGTLVDGVAPSAKGAPSVVDALADDLNTPAAIAEMHRMARSEEKQALASAMALMNFKAVDSDFHAAIRESEKDVVEDLLRQRAEARAAKEFDRADEIRDALSAADVIVMDKPGAQSEWRRGPNFDSLKLYPALRRR
ncbi:MAG: cysteine--tRNA ligase [Pseudomonadota bacterium]